MFFRLLAHVYHCHFDLVLALKEEAHLNTLFAHMMCFSKEFELLDRKELTPMAELITIFENNGRL
jgi:hypothetical protein